MAMPMAAAAAAAVALVAVMCVLAPRAGWCGGSSSEQTSSQNSSRNQTGARCYTWKTPDADAAAATQAASAATPATPPPRREDELVDRWPAWLLNSVPSEALQGIVHKSVQAYEKMEKVGQGSHSTVYKARERATGRVVALKKVRFNASDSESVRFMAREIEFQQRLDHRNVMRLEGVATSRRGVYLVFDFMYDDLGRLVFLSGQCLTEMQIKGYMQQLLQGLQHCHERGVLHLDIKPSNMLIDRRGVLKIGDFGLGSDYGAGSWQPPPSRVVSLWHRPPELLLGSTSYGVGVDLWSAGCVLAEMFFAKALVPGSGEKDQLLKIFSLFGSPPEDYWRKMELSPSLKPPETYKSTTAERFRDLPPSTIGLLATLLAVDPAARGTAGQALRSSFFSTPPLPIPVVYKVEEEVDASKPRARRHLGVISWRPGQNWSQALKDAEWTDDEWSDDELTDTANSGQEHEIDTGNAGQESAAAGHDAPSEKTIVSGSSSTVAKRFSASPVFEDASPVQNQMVAQDVKQVPMANNEDHHLIPAPGHHDGEVEETEGEPASGSGGAVNRGPESMSAAFMSDFEALRGSDELPSSKQYVLVDRV